MITDDLKFGWRQLTTAPGFSLIAILTLGIAIGANTAVFSLVDAALLKPLPYAQPERLGVLWHQHTRDGVVIEETPGGHTGRVWEGLRDHAPSIDGAVLSGLSANVSLVTGDRAMSVAPQRVSAGFFRVLGVAPVLGREFTREEDVPGGAAVAVLSDRLWRSAFDADSAVVGTSILLKGEPHVVVGIMPASFRTSVDADLWTPVRPSTRGEGSSPNYSIIVRLRDGVSWARARGEVAAVADPLLDRQTSDAGITLGHTLMPMQDDLASDVRMPLLLLSAAVALVLVVGCVNLAGLLLARAGRRTREMATRLAVGGDRRALVRQLLVESLVLAACGGLAGLAVGALALEGLKATGGDLLLTPWGQASLDARVLAVTLGLTALTAVLFGLVPAIQASRLDVNAALTQGGTRSVAGGTRGWPRRLLVAAEVALGVVLLVGTGLLVRTFVALESQPPGFDPRNLVAASASLEDARYGQHADIARLFDRSLERIRAIPGVDSAAVSLGLPYQRILNMGVQPLGGPAPGAFVFSTATYVTPGYFETLRLGVRRGRTLRDSDTTEAPHVLVVNESFVRRYFRDRDAVGERVRFGGTVREIVGVVADVRTRGGFNGFGPLDALPGVYVPFAQFPGSGLRVFHAWFSPAWIVRSGPGAVAEPALRRAMAEADPQLPLSAIRGIDEVRAEALERQRTLMQLVGALGALALFLAAIGIHALIASGVTERRREFGIRMALGATVSRTVRDAALPGIVMAGAGLVAGCVAAYAASGLIRSLLWGVEENDPLTFAAVVAGLLVVALIASVIPALRVRKLDPVSLLRAD